MLHGYQKQARAVGAEPRNAIHVAACFDNESSPALPTLQEAASPSRQVLAGLQHTGVQTRIPQSKRPACAEHAGAECAVYFSTSAGN